MKYNYTFAPSFRYGSGGAIIYYAAEAVVSNNPAALILTMTDLMQIISNGAANIKLEITSEDLRIFSDELINRAINEVALAFRAADEERLLSREEVKDMCGVCDATLWHWNKRNYLKAVKAGSKVRYRLSDVKRILGGTNKTGSNGSK